jgi:hypothetical protein
MARPRRLVASLALLAALASPAALLAQAPETQVAHVGRYVASPLSVGQKLVLVANRYSDFLASEDGTGKLAALAHEAEVHGQAVVALQADDGAGPSDHWERGGRAATSAPARAALARGGVDVLMLTLGPSGVDDGVDRFADLMVTTNMQGRILVQDAWAAGASSRVDSARLRRARAQLASINQRAGHEMAYLVPAADAVDRLRWEVALGRVPGVARQADLVVDGAGRPAEAVANLVTYLWFTVIYRQPPSGLTALVDPSDPTSAPREQVLQRVAWEAAAAEPMSGIMLEHIWLGRTRGVHPHAAEAGEGHEGHGAPTPHPLQMPPGRE